MGSNEPQELAYDFSVREVGDRKLEVDVKVPFDNETKIVTFAQTDAFFGRFNGLTFADDASEERFCDAVFNGILDITLQWPKDDSISEFTI